MPFNYTTLPSSTLPPQTSFDSALITDVVKKLNERIVGEVRFDIGSRALYATDGSNYRQVPIGVVIPVTTEDVIDTVALCHAHKLPVLPRGGGTSLAGQCCNTAVVMDMSKYLNKIVSLDHESKTAEVQPGVVLDWLRDAAEKHHLTFAPDPSTHNHNTLGGMIGNNSCGVHSVMGGRTEDNVLEMDVLTYDGVRMTVGPTAESELECIISEGGRRGEIYRQLRDLRDRHAALIRKRIPDLPRRVSGFNLDELLPEKGFNVARALVGTEGTCVTVLSAKLRLIDSPPERVLAVLGYPSVYEAGDHIRDIMACKPTGLEGMDTGLFEDMRRSGLHQQELELLPEGRGWLLVEFGGWTLEEACANAESVFKRLRKQRKPPSMVLYKETQQIKSVWKIRESGLGATSHVPGQPLTWPGWEDAAVPPDHVGAYLRDFQGLLNRYGYRGDLYGHFGQGCIHVRIDFDLNSKEGIEKYRRFSGEAARLVVKHKGSLSGEHGDGQSRGELLDIMYGEDMVDVFRQFKKIWDPDWKMNPGKVVDPYPRDSNLRIKGMADREDHVETFFKYPADHGNFNKAVLRCVGVGECRKVTSGTMCPSYMVTFEEKHSTRGRAHLLFEMLKGDTLKDGWKSQSVKEALDLCLSCKGCKRECPVNVDMATYKAEFFYHHHKHYRRPLNNYLFGYINDLARWGMLSPALFNFATQNRLLSRLGKTIAGIDQRRELPTLAKQSFTDWFRKRQTGKSDGPEVMLWPDTFNNYFTPEVGKAAVEVLETAGYQVKLPDRIICCGRPLYEFGFLETARKRLESILQTLEQPLEKDMPLIGLEPACTSVFRDELCELFPDDDRAGVLRQNTYSFSEFLHNRAGHFQIPKLKKRALAHMHCNHKAILGTEADKALLNGLDLDCNILDAGCCGMAGSFGYHKEKYPVSIKCGERVLLPAVRGSDDDTLIIADGYSCREQIQQETRRRAVHTAQVVQMALNR